MNRQRKMNLLQFGLMLVMLGICSMPYLAGAVALPIPTGPTTLGKNTPSTLGTTVPDYFTTANWANSPQLSKFVDTLPGLTPANANNLGQHLPVAVADTTTYPGSDYYIIALRQYSKKMHRDLNPTTLRGYVQLNEAGEVVGEINYLGPVIVAQRDRPVRLKFINQLPVTDPKNPNDGRLFIPVDTSVMGAGQGPATLAGAPCDNTPLINSCAYYPENRADIHLHGGRTPWISDGTPHQWITPADEVTPFVKGVSFQNVPDMPDPGPGAATYYFTNQQSARLMFYHDHAFGITRLNVYAGEAAGYVITDEFEASLAGKLPADMIPLIIQDKSFVDATPTEKFIYNPETGLFDDPITVPKVRVTDPLWNWGSGPVDGAGVRTPVTGDLWMPHVYMTAQTSTAGAGGVNPFGRWMYGPWFFPATIIDVGPKANPYYDLNCSSLNPFELADCLTPGQPVKIPGTPNVSMGMEAFQDTVVVNGTVFPTLTVDPKSYRFRILNASGDRYQNLSFYVADSTPANLSPEAALAGAGADARGYLRSNRTEVKMVPASAQLAIDNNWPALWPTDGRAGGVPDPGFCQPGGVNCPNLGPSFLQIATEGGFLPQPVTIVPQPITYNTDPTAFWVGNVNKMGLGLGAAERADVVVDFSKYAGQTLILYNDAPAAWPAGQVTYDYYTGAPDLRDSGGFGTGGTWDAITGSWVNGTGPLPGKGPNTRTVLQVIVKSGTPAAAFDEATLRAEFTTPKVDEPYKGTTLFERAQEPIIVGQAAYAASYPNSYFPTNFPWEGINQINDHFLDFVTVKGEQVHALTEPKGIHDEMGASFDPIYGRMSGNLGTGLPNMTTLTANLVLYGYSDLATETIKNSIGAEVSVNAATKTLTDGTQIWKISHNGVDTHPIHFHIFDVQLLNRVGWDGQILLPEPNELGWKDTIKISPLEDTIVAVRPRAPSLPFGIPNSLRPLNPAYPLDTLMGFNNVDPATGQAYVAPSQFAGGVTNVLYDFGWEYVWHCHILSHEEMDMMRPVVLKYESTPPPAFPSFTASVSGSDVVLNWQDATPFTYPDVAPAPDSYRNTGSEIGFNVYRSATGAFPIDPVTGKPAGLLNVDLLGKPKALRANFDLSFTAVGTASSIGTDTYMVEAFNAAGSTFAYVGAARTDYTADIAATSGPNFLAGAGVPLVVSTVNMPDISKITYYDGTNLIATIAAALPATTVPTPATFTWTSTVTGAHSMSAKLYLAGGAVITTAPITVNIIGPVVANYTPDGSTPFGKCDVIPFISTSTGPITGYSWLINGINYNTATVNTKLPLGIHSVTLGVVNGIVASDQITRNIEVAGGNVLPVPNHGGPYSIIPSNPSLTLNGTGTDADACVGDTLSYAWDLDGKNGYEFLTGNPTITYNALVKVLGAGVHTVYFKVTDAAGGSATTSTTLTVITTTAAKPGAIVVSPASSSTGNYSVSWAPSATAGVSYTLQESTDPTFLSGVTTTVNAVSPVAITGKTSSTYYYRVKAVKFLTADSAWSVIGQCVVLLPPAMPTSPAPTGSVVTATPTYTWNESVTATSYDLITVVGSVTTTTNYLSSICVAGVCSVVSPSLANGTNVYWNVRANNASGSSGYTATTWFKVNIIPATPTSPAPTGTVSTLTPTYTWNNSAGATSYDLLTVINGVTTTTNYLQSAICSAGTCSVVSPAIPSGSNVYWNVRAKNAAGASDYTVTALFQVVVIPATPTSPAPTGTVASYTPTYTWNDSYGATSYDLLTVVNGVTTTTNYLKSAICSAGVCSVISPSLAANSNVYWNVRALNASGSSSYTATKWFQVVVIPVTPTSPAPTGKIATTTPTYTWNDSYGATSYDLLTVINGVTTTTNYLQSAICSAGVCSVVSPAITNGSNVYWNVRAKNAFGNSNYTATTQFRVFVIPATPTSLAPSGIVATATPVYTWNDSVGATSYELLTVVNGVTTITKYQQSAICSLGTCSVVSPSLSTGTNVYWNVQAENSIGSSKYTATLWFRAQY